MNSLVTITTMPWGSRILEVLRSAKGHNSVWSQGHISGQTICGFLAPQVRLRHACIIKCTNIIKDGEGNITSLEATWDPESKGGNPADGRKVCDHSPASKSVRSNGGLNCPSMSLAIWFLTVAR